MPDFLLPLFLNACMSGTYNYSCQRIIEASYVQAGYSSQVNTFQNQVMDFGKSKEKSTFGNSTNTVNTLVAAGIILKNKKADLSLPNFGVCDRFSTQIQPSTYGVKIEWRW